MGIVGGGSGGVQLCLRRFQLLGGRSPDSLGHGNILADGLADTEVGVAASLLCVCGILLRAYACVTELWFGIAIEKHT